MKDKFSFDTIQNFDEHILASIPNYDVLFDSLLILSDYFITKEKTVYDVGCSTGKLLKALDAKYQDINDIKFIGYDRSFNLLPKEEEARIEFIERDLNRGGIFTDASLVFSIFTLQFLDKEARPVLLKKIYDGLCKGGAFIVTEKVYSNYGQIQDIYTSSYYDYKKQSFTEKQILDKEVDLRKILKPNTSEENIAMLEYAGFETVVYFYKYLNFEGYICIK